MKSAVIYKSKYGTTKQYAQWAAEKIGADIFESKQFNPADFEKYDTIIYFGGVYTGSIANIGLITNNFYKMDGKNVIVCPVCLTKPENTERINEIIARNISYPICDKVKVFPLRGAIEYKKLSFVDKLMMKSATVSFAEKVNIDQNYVSIDNLNPLLEYLGGLK